MTREQILDTPVQPVIGMQTLHDAITADPSLCDIDEPVQSPPPDSFTIRGKLTALKCWHRLTEAEADDLIVFTAMLVAREAK